MADDRKMIMAIRLERLQKIFDQAAKLVSRHDHFEDTALKLLAIIGEALQCDWGTYWEVDSRRHSLRAIATWSVPEIKARDLERDTRSKNLSLSEGTAGHVWRGKKPIWTTDLISDMCLPRSLEAESAGLHGGVWFAVKTDLAVYGVIELLGKKVHPPTEELLLGIEAFGIKLGRLLESSQISQNPDASHLSETSF